MIRSIDEAVLDFERVYREVMREPSQQTQEFCRKQALATYASVGAQYFQLLEQNNLEEFDLQQQIKKWNNQEVLPQLMSQGQIKNIQASSTYINQKLIGTRKISGKKEFDNIFKNNKLILFEAQKMKGNINNLKREMSHSYSQQGNSNTSSNLVNQNRGYLQYGRQNKDRYREDQNKIGYNNFSSDRDYGLKQRDRQRDQRDRDYYNRDRERDNYRDNYFNMSGRRSRQKEERSQSYHKERDRDSRQYRKQRQRQRQYSKQGKQGNQRQRQRDRQINYKDRDHFNASKINQNYNMSSYNQQQSQINYPLGYYTLMQNQTQNQSYNRNNIQKQEEGYWNNSDHSYKQVQYSSRQRQRDNYKGYDYYGSGFSQNGNQINYNRDVKQSRLQSKQIRAESRDQRDKNSGQYYQKRVINSISGKY